jgi:hypothetical protein
MQIKRFFLYSGWIWFGKKLEIYEIDDLKKLKKRETVGVFDPQEDMLFRPKHPIKVLGWQGSISSFRRLHTKVFFKIFDRMDKSVGEFAILNTGDCGNANGGQMFNEPIILDGGSSILLCLWAHNMDLTWLYRDFHADYTLFYEEM